MLISSSKISTEGIYLNLLLKDGVVSSNALTHCGSLLSGVIVVPNEPFRYQLKGFDSEGNDFEETREVKLSPETESCPTTSPTSGFVECPCLNGGRCISFTRFDRTHIACGCPEGYSGSHCQIGKLISHNSSMIFLIIHYFQNYREDGWLLHKLLLQDLISFLYCSISSNT